MKNPLSCFSLAVLLALGPGTLVHAAAPELPKIPDRTFNVLKYGAVADGKTMDTAAIQKAINAASAAGGGVVLFPSGKFLTGPFSLASRINLHLARGATLLIRDDRANYPVEHHRYVDSITVSDAHDIAITGEGTINGQGRSWWTAFRANRSMTHRPYMIRLSDCDRVLVENVTLTDSPMFHLVPKNCMNVTIRHVTIKAPADAPNTDGIDPSGWHYLITNCHIDTGDDNIAIKPNHARSPGNNDFLVTDCEFLHGHGMSIGSGTEGGIEDLTVSNCTFDATDSGIRIKTARGRGGVLQRLTYEGLKMTAVKYPIRIVDYYPERTAPKNPADAKTEPVTVRTPVNQDITIRNVTATDCATAGVMVGLPEAPISDVTLSNVHISARKGMKISYARGIRFVDSTIQVEQGKRLQLYDAMVTGLK